MANYINSDDKKIVWRLKYMAKIVYKLVQKLTQSSRSLYYPERSY